VADLWPGSTGGRRRRCFTASAFPPDWALRCGCSHSSARRRLRGAIVPVVAAKLWHLGVLIGLAGILSGNSTALRGWNFRAPGSVVLFFAYLLLALWAMINFAARHERALFPSHWFFGPPRCLVSVDLFDGQLVLVACRCAGAARAIRHQPRGLPTTCCRLARRLSASAQRSIS